NPQKLRVVNIRPNPESIPITWRPHTRAEKLLVDLRDWLWRPLIERAVRRYGLDTFDVYQLDGGLDLYRNASFITEMKRRGKKVICCYTGSDLRTRGVIPAVDAISDLNVTVEFDHLALHPQIHYVGFPFDADCFQPHLHHDNDKAVRIGHAPTNRAAKGSDVIIPILRQLEAELGTETVLIEGLPYAQALALKQTCDIFVDQIGDLGYGINSLEALAMEIPACSCLAPGFAEQFPNHPFIDVQADNLRQELVRLIAQPNLRREIGRKGKEWVKAHHDPVEVVRAVHRLAQIED
ncbi:MAG: glycosyltransferase, partial [candidate division KSB1 bacterium]|nr:glycosyltransferase [candidate division KSB1 bacterium]